MPHPYHPHVLPDWLDGALRAAGTGLAGVALGAAWLTAGPGNWVSPPSSPGISLEARHGAALRCAASTVGASVIPAQN